MNDNQKEMQARVFQALESILNRQQYVSPIDMFIEMRLLQPIHVQDWRKDRIPHLESCIQWNLKKTSLAMKWYRQWVAEQGLKPSPTSYLARSKQELRFSVSGNADIERAYRMHFVSPLLSEKKKIRLQTKLEKPPELIVFIEEPAFNQALTAIKE